MRQEIIYIGKSKNISTRVKHHEKIIRAFASLDDTKDLLINFIKPSFAYTDIENQAFVHFDKGTLLKTNLVKMDYDVLIKLAERILINYFQPELNSDFKRLDFKNDEIINKIKTITEFDELICITELEGNSYDFYTKFQKLNSKNFLLNNNFEYVEYK